MNRFKGLVAICILQFFLISFAGCSSRTDDVGDTDDQLDRFQGIVYALEDNRILVIQDLENVNIPWSLWFEEGKRAVSFSITEGETIIEIAGEEQDPAALARGQTVEIWHSGALAESYPEQGSALKVIIIDPAAAEEAFTDSGRFAGLSNNTGNVLIMIRISGIPDELPPRSYRLTTEAAKIVENLSLTEGTEVIFRYLADEQSDGLIFDLSTF
jgi:hypothetical protein